MRPPFPPLEKLRRLALFREMAAIFLFPDDLSITANLKDPASSTDQVNSFTSRFFNLSRYPISFWTIVSLLAILNFDFHPHYY